MNKAIIMGRLGQDPELRHTAGGQAVCNLSVATSSYTGKGDDRKELTEWHKVVVWGNQAEACGNYLAKGREVLVEGRIQTSSWEDKDGVKRYKTEIVAHHVQFIGGRGDERKQEAVPGVKREPEPVDDKPSLPGMDDDGSEFPF